MIFIICQIVSCIMYSVYSTVSGNGFLLTLCCCSWFLLRPWRLLLPAGPPRVPRKRLPLLRLPPALCLRNSARSCSLVVRLATLRLLSVLFCFLLFCCLFVCCLLFCCF